MTTKYPEIKVQLSGTDGNAFAVISKVRSALRKGGCTASEIGDFMDEAMSGDYDNVLTTAMRWVGVS